MKRITYLAAMVMLAGCTGIVESTEKAKNSVRGGIYHTAGKVQELTKYDPGPTEPQAPQTGFCYKMASDIVCYSQPQPGMTSKLVGAQTGGTMQSYAAAPVFRVDPVEPVQVQATPFYVKEAPYVKADGELTQATRILPHHQTLDVRGQSGSAVIMPGQNYGGQTTYNSGMPQPLMPRH